MLTGTFLFVGTLLISGCSPDTDQQDSTDSLKRQQNRVIITFKPEFKGQPIQCEQALKIRNGMHDETWRISEFAMFLSQFSLNKEHPIILDDNDWQSQQVVLIRSLNDCKQSISNMMVSGFINGDIVAWERGVHSELNNSPILSFDIGVPFALNHQNPLLQASPLNDSSMFWAWRNGYKFIRWDMQSDNAFADDENQDMNGNEGGIDSWSFHLGSVGCESAAMVRSPKMPCAQPNVVPIEVSLQSDSIQIGDNKEMHIQLTINLDNILERIHLTQANTCMFSGIDNQSCDDLVKNLQKEVIFD
jgi:uncharacterized repeat protein (TIGR04052 family)